MRSTAVGQHQAQRPLKFKPDVWERLAVLERPPEPEEIDLDYGNFNGDTPQYGNSMIMLR